jgi:excisionase family DNA binding protein
METILTPKEVAQHLKLSKAKVYYLIKRKIIPHIRIGKNVRVFESQLKQWLESLAVK